MDRKVGRRETSRIWIRRYSKPEACVAVDIRMEENVSMYGEGTNCRSKRRGGEGYRFQASRSRGRTQQKQKWGWVSLFLSVFCWPAAQKKRGRKDDGEKMRGSVGFISIDMRRLAPWGIVTVLRVLDCTVRYGKVWSVSVLSPNPSWISVDSTEVENRRNSRKLRSNEIFSMCGLWWWMKDDRE